MKTAFFASILLFSLQACSIFVTKTPQVQVQGAGGANQQMFTGDSAIATTQVPASVLATWNKEHSGTKAEWHKTKDGYMVFYIHKKYQSRVLYDESGNELLHGHEVKSEDVPASIREYMKAKYPGTQYGRTFLSYLPNGEKQYNVHVSNDTWETFDMQGKSIERTKQ